MIETAKSIIDSSLKLIGVLGVGTEVTTAEYDECLLQLNRLMDTWNNDDLLVYSITANTFPLVIGTKTYTLGEQGDFNMVRPSRIEKVSIVYGTSPEIELPISAENQVENWQNIVVKDVTSTFPLFVYLNYNFPHIECNFWPVPGAPCAVRFYVWEPFPLVQTIDDDIVLPPGYSDALVYNLALRLAQLFDRQPSQHVQQMAIRTASSINDINSGSISLKIM